MTTPPSVATTAQIAQFEHRNRVRLPDDLRQYVRNDNGATSDGVSSLLRIWPLAEIKSLSTLVASAPAGASTIQATYNNTPTTAMKDLYVFADGLWEAQLYALRLSADTALTPVFVIDGGDPAEVAPSFAAFLTASRTAPASIRLLE